MGFSLHPFQPQWEAQSLFPSHQHPGMIQRRGMHLVWILGIHLLFNKKMKRKLVYLGAVPERGHPELQGGCNGVTHWRAGGQDLGWCVLHALWAKENETHLLKTPVLGSGTGFSLLAVFHSQPCTNKL